MPHWHWHIFTLTWVRAFKSSCAQWTHCKTSVPVTLPDSKVLAEKQFSGQPIQSLSSGNQFGCWLNSVRLGRFKQNGFSGQHIQSLGAGNQFGAEATSWHLLCRGLSWKWILCKKLFKRGWEGSFLNVHFIYCAQPTQFEISRAHISFFLTE